jgi:hypothetical protein
MDHLYIDVIGVIPGCWTSTRLAIGRQASGCRAITTSEQRTAPFLRGFSYQGGAHACELDARLSVPGYGTALKQHLREYGPWTFDLSAFLECLPYRD